MNRFNSIRSALIQVMCEAGELIRRGDDMFEDMGGHILHESNLDYYITEYMKQLSEEERTELVNQTKGE